jgi:hypothetical protein
MASLSAANVTRVNGTHLEITIGTLRDYAIDTDEVVGASLLPASLMTSAVAFNMTTGSFFTVTDTGFVVRAEGSSLACDAAGSLFTIMGAGSNLTIAVYGSNFDTAAWGVSASAFAFYDALGLTGVPEFACLSAHVLNADRPDKLVHPASFAVTAQTAQITFPRRLPAYLRQLAAARSVTLPAAAVTAALTVSIDLFCSLVWT